jgi:hypothetical protein
MLMSCFAAAALITSPTFGEMHKKSMATSASKAQRMAPRTTQVTPAMHHATMQTTPMYRRGSSSPYAGTRQYAGTRYYGSSRYGDTGYYGGSRYYSGGGGWSYPYYNYSYWPYNYSYWPGNSYGYYPYSYYEGYPYTYSYYGSGYGYHATMVAQVQRRLGELGYYHGIVDGIMGPQTRTAVAAYEGTHNLVVDGTISQRLLARMGLA